MTPSEPTAVDELRAQVAGPVFAAGDQQLAAEVAAFQLAVTHHPAVAVGATSAEDVAAAVRWAVGHHLPVSVQATGHGPIQPADGAMLITTGRMRAVSVDPDRRRATASAGARWADVVAVTAEHGLAPLSGSSSGVGVVGYSLIGGIGPLAREYGFAADLVTRVELVGADGKIRQVDADTDPELFWAVRGGKANFGVVTEIEFGLVPVSSLAAGGIYLDGADAARLLATYRTWTATLPERTTTSLALLRAPDLPQVPEPLRGRLSVHLRFAHDGPLEEAERVVAPMLAAGTVLLGGIGRLPVTETDRIHDDPTAPGASWDGGLLLGALEPGAVEAILAAVGPAVESPLTLVELRHLGGALGRQPAVPNAVAGRDGAFSVFVVGVLAPPVAEAVPAAAEALLAALAPWTLESNLLGIAGAASPERLARIFGAETYQRLLRVKDAVDPDNVFRVGHALR